MSAGQAAGWAILAVMLLLAVVGTARWLYDSTEPYGTHCAPAPARRTGRLRALRASVELRLAWWRWPPVQAHWYRQYWRADRRALAAEMAQARTDLPAREVDCGRAARRTPGRPESGPATGAAPDLARSGAVPQIVPFVGELTREELAQLRDNLAAVLSGRPALPPLRLCCPTTEREAHTHRCEATRVYPAPTPESNPYPPTMYPRTAGDGLIALGPDGCEVVPRPRFGRHAAETSCDMPVLFGVPRYLDACPGGTE